jgi:hypothetical protein
MLGNQGSWGRSADLTATKTRAPLLVVGLDASDVLGPMTFDQAFGLEPGVAGLVRGYFRQWSLIG